MNLEFYGQLLRRHSGKVAEIAEQNLQNGVYDTFSQYQTNEMVRIASDIILAFESGYFKAPDICEAIGEYLWYRGNVGEVQLLTRNIVAWWRTLKLTTNLRHEVVELRVTERGAVDRFYEETMEIHYALLFLTDGSARKTIDPKERLGEAIRAYDTDDPDTAMDVFVAVCGYTGVDYSAYSFVQKLIEVSAPYHEDWDTFRQIVQNIDDFTDRDSTKVSHAQANERLQRSRSDSPSRELAAKIRELRSAGYTRERIRVILHSDYSELVDGRDESYPSDETQRRLAKNFDPHN